MFKISEYTNFENTDDLKVIISEYIESLGIDISFQQFDKEANDLGSLYSKSSGGAFLVVMDEKKIIGCVGLKRIDVESCEMKRLYVKPGFRKKGLGKLLAEGIIQKGKEMKYLKMKLDVLQKSKEAIKLYEELGFYKIAPYYFNPHDAVFMEINLSEHQK